MATYMDAVEGKHNSGEEVSLQKFRVSVEKRLYATGSVEILANNSEEALEKVQERINTGKLQTTQIKWSEPEYEDGSFDITGDVD